MAAAVGERRLGFPVDRMGTHSIQAAAVMAIFLAGVPCETIQLIGRWRSRTFMTYLRIQVAASTRGVTTKMTSLDSFFIVTESDNSDKNDGEHDSKMAETRSTHANAHEQTRNAKREASGRLTNH